MSLDVYLTTPREVRTKPATIYIRENGANRAITAEEWNERFPGTTPCVIEDDSTSDEVYQANITHNLGRMAVACGIYQHLWRPEELGIKYAWQLISPLRSGLDLLRADPTHYKTFDATNGWGTYDGFVPFVEKYLAACIEHPNATVSVSR